MLVINQVPRHTFIAVNALAQTCVIPDIVGQAFADDDAAKRLCSSVGDRMGNAAFAVADEITRSDLMGVFTDIGSGCAA